MIETISNPKGIVFLPYALRSASINPKITTGTVIHNHIQISKDVFYSDKQRPPAER